MIYQIREDCDRVFNSLSKKIISRDWYDFVKVTNDLYATYANALTLSPLVVVNIPDEFMVVDKDTRFFEDKELFVNKITKESQKYFKLSEFKKELENI